MIKVFGATSLPFPLNALKRAQVTYEIPSLIKSHLKTLRQRSYKVKFAIIHGGIMPLAFVLLNVEAGADKEVLENMRKIPEIKASYMVYGVYDIVAMVESDTLEKLREMVTKKIRQLDKVSSTMTMIVMED